MAPSLCSTRSPRLAAGVPGRCLRAPSRAPASRRRLTVAHVSVAGQAAAASSPARPGSAGFKLGQNVMPSAGPATPASGAPGAPAGGLLVLDSELARCATQKELEVVESLKPVFEEQILPLLPPAEEMWQPSDFLPDSSAHGEDGFFDGIRDLRARTAGLPDDLLVCIVGDAITEEALPTYMAMINTLDGVRDQTGRDEHPYARWTRSWIAEENRHGDLLNKYMYLSGRVDMHAVEVTIQKLVSAGMDPGTKHHPYNAFIFTSFQERATKVSHGSTARKAAAAGDDALAAICGTIARDESRHEAAYTRTIDAVFDRDPSGAMLAFARMMARKVTMPAHLMDDGEHEAINLAITGQKRNLFADFSAVAERSGVYTARDYTSILRHLIRRWRIQERTGLTDAAAAARDFLCALPGRFEKLAERRSKRAAAVPPSDVAFSWVFNRKIKV